MVEATNKILFGEGSITRNRSELQKRVVGNQLKSVGYKGKISGKDRPLEKLARRGAFNEIQARRKEVEHSRLKGTLEVDALTGLLNKPAFDKRLNEAVEDAIRTGHNYHLLMIDLDNFKLVNDTAGHAAGDDILRSVGHLLGRTTRDPVARLGGDEFGILAKSDDPLLPNFLAERIGVNFDNYSHTNYIFSMIEASIGAASYHGSEPLTAKEFLQRADDAMTHSKMRKGTTLTPWHPSMKRELVGSSRR